MEPCLFRHGKVKVWDDIGTASDELQWSHVFSDMVSANDDDVVACDGVTASMEPCLFRHGKLYNNNFADVLTGSFNGAMSFQTW